MLKLELDMKITDERLAFFHLFDNGFTEHEIDFIKKRTDKEGIAFCVKTFCKDDLEEMKTELREYMKNQAFRKIKNMTKGLFKYSSKVVKY